ncbi:MULTISPECIES: ATP-dependent helicase [unclassified Herbaspirillum]|uniref:ATP-dependent helicase n=1 Tax=unclassified Herbaspirillum TaxID=2624150 RepID=UPI00115025F5|nr:MULTISPECIES: ATP-dependent helicase [unclassified Herbaspirillum]MBB5393496.1 DNA helicase-2/ATP-dependent DNA helicase PcrA [Herbaspirillum sp. SJZ102]TQK03756.1 DNA helicase-2/ATP-dependent DNA helicase PcrA [Herbaspirillum sp. SJZ130]TQK08488.1 DNA helicase-2/ATP-dependent DNA helicase PcrA [Herbaspirillum sp. SJZ106]
MLPDPAAALDTAAPAADARHALFAKLNEQQRAAVEHGGTLPPARHDPLLIVAGAGSGKTSTLAHRVARLVLDGADPQRILLLTFSRRAAADMGRRVGQVIGQALQLPPSAQPPQLPWSGTFHAIGARLLRDYAAQIGLEKNFTIQDRGDSEDLMGLLRHEMGLTATDKRFPLKATCLAIYSRAVNTRENLGTVLHTQFPWCREWEAQLAELFSAYVDAKERQHVLDYDDLLLFWADMLSDAELARHAGERFDHVLVDEYQDTNRLQAEILKRMKPDGAGVTAVGDDAQSIYSFRGATVRNILDFPALFSRPARIVTLERNYRSTQPILAASNAVIAEAPERHHKNLWSDRASSQKPQLVLIPDEVEQARWIANRVLAHREQGLTLKSQAVLFRTATHSAALELELARRNIPFLKFGGLKFLESTHIKDLLSLLRLAHNPNGRMAGFRALQLIAGIGPTTARKALDLMAAADNPAAALLNFAPPANAALEWQAFADTYALMRHASTPWPDDLHAARDWYLPQLERKYDDAGARSADIEQLAALAGGYASREKFLTELTLDPPEASSDYAEPPYRDEDYLTLSTIHSAKGQEWRSVHVLNVVDGCIPSDLATGNEAEIAEERRLLYVAMTRAKEYLHLVVPQRFYVTQQTPQGDRHVNAIRSRFITPRMLPHFEDSLWLSAETNGARTPMPDSVRMLVRQRARNAWKQD